MKNRIHYPGPGPGTFNRVAVFIICLIFLVLGLVFSKNGVFYLWIIPICLVLFIIAIYSIDIFLLIIVFLTPLSVQLRFIIADPKVDLFLPTELMLFGILLLVSYKLLVTKEFSRKSLLHPVSLIILFTIIWALLTSITSVNLIVSLKNILSRLWFISGFYLLALTLFRKKDLINRYLIAYIAGMIPVIIYFLVRMINSGLFNQTMSHSVIRPFFNDHTSFGAALAFCLPVLVYFIFRKGATFSRKIIFLLTFILFAAAFIFSYSRAAWLSIIGTIVFVLIIILRIPWKLVLASVIIIIVIFFTSWPAVSQKLASNRQVSTSNLTLHLKSVSNISSDVSNRERINRWKSAMRMFVEKPVMGWGPGTFQFEYASYQLAEDKTEISTNFGEKGNAHSEYLGSLVDSGVPALLLYLGLLIIPLVQGIRFFKRTKGKDERWLVIALMAGLVTYVIHGFLNNFLDTDKISALFWGYIAAITALDLSLKDGEENNSVVQEISAAIIDTSSNR